MPTFAAMAESKRPALVLAETAVFSGEAVHFANFPGRYAPGEPVAFDELDLGGDDAVRARVEELGLPLDETTVAAGEGLPLRDDNRAPGADEVRGTDWQPEPGEPGGPLEPGETFPPTTVTPTATDVSAALDANAPDVIDAVNRIDDLATLQAMLDAEKAGKNRSTVTGALEARVAGVGAWGSVTPPAPPDQPQPTVEGEV